MKLFPPSSISSLIWSFGFLPGMLACGLLLTCTCRALQFRRLGYALRHTVGTPSARAEDGVSPFQAASTALASTVGTGNIVGTAQAIAMGGPGALLWLWLTAALGMIIKYAEVALSSLYRSADGSPAGPMPYIEAGLHSHFAARCYAFFALFAGFGMGNLTQVSSIASCVLSLARPHLPAGGELSARLALGLFLALLTALAMTGGAKRVGRISELLFPFMTALFLFAAAAVLVVNASRIPSVFYLVVRSAFSPRSVFGAASGLGLRECILWGVRRSAFSNEAGLGCSALAHSSAPAGNPAMHGLWGIFEVFADTLVICSATGFAILCSGVPIPWGSAVGPELFQSALASVFGNRAAALLLTAVLGLFAFSSVLGWSLYGQICASYLWGATAKTIYCVLFVFVIVVGSILSTKRVWAIADFFNALMSLPNLAALAALSETAGNLRLDE